MLLIPLNKHEVEALLSDPALRIVLCLLVAALRERRSFASWWCLILGAWGILILASKWQKIKFSPFKCRRSIRPLPGKRWRGGGGGGVGGCGLNEMLFSVIFYDCKKRDYYEFLFFWRFSFTSGEGVTKFHFFSGTV